MNSPSDFLTMWQHNRVFPDPKDGLQGDRGFLEIQAKELNKIFKNIKTRKITPLKKWGNMKCYLSNQTFLRSSIPFNLPVLKFLTQGFLTVR